MPYAKGVSLTTIGHPLHYGRLILTPTLVLDRAQPVTTEYRGVSTLRNSANSGVADADAVEPKANFVYFTKIAMPLDEIDKRTQVTCTQKIW